ncbi:MAG: hypothetical protein ACKO7D_04900 [Bacteroidota bacterium]
MRINFFQLPSASHNQNDQADIICLQETKASVEQVKDTVASLSDYQVLPIHFQNLEHTH